MDWKILERNGVFLVGKMVTKKNWIFGKRYEEFETTFKGFFIPARFNTLKEAMEFVKKISKPDTFHPIK